MHYSASDGGSSDLPRVLSADMSELKAHSERPLAITRPETVAVEWDAWFASPAQSAE